MDADRVTMGRMLRYWRDRSGASAVEMAFVLPGFLFLLLGGSSLVLVTYANMCLNAASEAGARYASALSAAAVAAGNSPTLTPSQVTATQNYATSVYKGPGMNGLGFVYSTPANTCGGQNNVMTATGNYHLFYGVGNITIPMSATACFP